VLDATIGEEWLDDRGGYGLFVVAHVEAVPKEGIGIPMSSTGRSHAVVQMLIRALRLNGEGVVATGPLYFLQVGRFGKSPGIARTGRPNVSAFGQEMMFVAVRDRPAVEAIFSDLKAFEAVSARNVDALRVAIARFDASYGRSWLVADRLIDDMIGLEALLGDSAELAYSIAIRASGLLAASDSDRVRLFARLAQLLQSAQRCRAWAEALGRTRGRDPTRTRAARRSSPPHPWLPPPPQCRRISVR